MKMRIHYALVVINVNTGVVDMSVLLIDVDSKIPNLALMKVSSYYKAHGEEVGFNVSEPTKVYCSIVFTKNKHRADGLRLFYPNAEINVGGTGYDVAKKLPQEIEECSPDYSIYPSCEKYYGFTSRGCIRNCPFCFVPMKEGKFYRLHDTAKEAIDHILGNGHYKQIEIMDNNILADKEWFMEVSQEILDRGWKVDFNQGLDIRLLDDEIATRLSKLRPISTWKFAFDNTNYEKAVLKGIDTLNNNGVNVRSKCMFYVYCDGDHAYDDTVYRCRTLKEHNALAYVMVNPERVLTDRVKHLKRWTRPWLYWSADITEYGKVVE